MGKVGIFKKKTVLSCCRVDEKKEKMVPSINMFTQGVKSTKSKVARFY